MLILLFNTAGAKASDEKPSAGSAAASSVSTESAPEGAEQQKPVSSSAKARDASSQAYDGRAFAFGLTAGYYVPVKDVYGLELNPFGWAVGGTAAWMHSSGFTLGLHAQYFFGDTISQTYEPPLTTYQIPMDAQSQMTSIALTFGFEQRLDPIVLRYVLDVGASLLSWNFGDTGYTGLAGFPTSEGTSVGAHLAPGVGVMVPLGAFYAGAEVRYRVEVVGYGPGALGGHLHLGWRL